MILPEGLAGHCLTVIRLLQLCGEGWLGVAWRGGGGGGVGGKKKGKKEKSSVREREGEKEELEGRRNHCLLWTPSLTRPNLQDILDSSTLPLQLCSFLSSFSGSLPFRFPTRRGFSSTQRGKRVLRVLPQSCFY